MIHRKAEREPRMGKTLSVRSMLFSRRFDEQLEFSTRRATEQLKNEQLFRLFALSSLNSEPIDSNFGLSS